MLDAPSEIREPGDCSCGHQQIAESTSFEDVQDLKSLFERPLKQCGRRAGPREELLCRRLGLGRDKLTALWGRPQLKGPWS